MENVPQLRKRLEEHLQELPSLPTVVARLMTLDRRDGAFFDKLLATLESDPNLSTRVLACANSASSASCMTITTLRTALSRIGSHAAANLLLSMAMTSVFVPRDPWEKSLWRHAIQVAGAAREFALLSSEGDVDPDEAYAAGLLHDIGRFVMFQEAPEQLRRIDEAEWDTPEGLLAMERSICGLTHAELGAFACHRWGIPETIAKLVEDHHANLKDRPVDELTKLIAVVQVADACMFPSAMPGTPGLEESSDGLLKSIVAPLPASIAIDLPELRKLLRRVAESAGELADSLGVG